MAAKVNLHASPARSPSRRNSPCSGLSCGSCASATTDSNQSTMTHQRMPRPPLVHPDPRSLLLSSTRSAVLFRPVSLRSALGRFIRDGGNFDDALALLRPQPSDALRGSVVMSGVDRLR